MVKIMDDFIDQITSFSRSGDIASFSTLCNVFIAQYPHYKNEVAERVVTILANHYIPTKVDAGDFGIWANSKEGRDLNWSKNIRITFTNYLFLETAIKRIIEEVNKSTHNIDTNENTRL